MSNTHSLITLMRPRQWIKNLFVIAPLIFSGEFSSTSAIQQVFLAAIMFCIASSATYIVNDIHDIENDRKHPKKSKARPLASGSVSIKSAIFLLFLLYTILILTAFLVPQVFKIILIYICLNFVYTFVLKHQPVVDIFTIAIGFVLRVYAGASALLVPVSDWMFVTTLCLALYLASVKRRQELIQGGVSARSVLKSYSISLMDRYAEMSATGALVFYSMFVMSSRPELAVSVPIVLFGIFRYWYVVEKLNAGESPTDAVLDDTWLLLTVVFWISVCIWNFLPMRG